MKTIPYEKFKHGQRVTCEIEGETIKDAKISIEVPYGSIYVCQNRKKGQRADDLLGYQHSWKIVYKNEDFYDGKEKVENLQFLPRTLDELEEGDIVLKTGDEWKILGICGDVYFMSICNNFKRTGTFLTKEELKDEGYTLKQEEEGIETLIRDFPVFITKDEEKMKYKGKTYILSKYL